MKNESIPQQEKVRYIIKWYLIALLSSITVASIIFMLFQPEPKESVESHVLIEFFGVVIFAPVVETLLMIPILGGIGVFTKNAPLTVLISALVWAIGHSLIWPPWGVVVFIPFLVFSHAFLQWKRESTKSAFIVVVSIHALINLTAFVGGEITKRLENRENQSVANQAAHATPASRSTTGLRVWL
jgi:hypothetical protein